MPVLPRPDDPVREHYERWPYPLPIENLATHDFNAIDFRIRDLRELYWAYWPTAKTYREDLDLLVAGCGTSVAAAYAYLYPEARVIGIDISSASLACEVRLQQQHNLTNLTLYQLPIDQVASLNKQFDFIVTHGVLHHLVDPVSELVSLKDVLRPDGIIAIMVYSWYSKFGVYMLQELFHRLDVKQDDAGLALVKETLRHVGPSHPVQQHLRLAGDLGNDNGLVDCFLHRRDRAFTVANCLELVAKSGLAFGGWDEPGFYHPEAQLQPGSPLRTAIEKLPREEMWKAMELFNGNIPCHWFFACRADRDPRTWQPDLGSDAFLNYVPIPRCREVGRTALGSVISRPPYPQIQLNGAQSVLYRHIDGVRTIAQCIANAASAEKPGIPVQFAREFFRTMNRVGYMYFKISAP